MKQTLFLIQVEWQKKWQIARSYWISLLADQLFFILGFLIVAGLFDLVAAGNFDRWARLSALIGYLTWRVAGGCMVEIGASIAVDAQYGVLEQVWLSHVSPGRILFARSVALILFYSLRVLLMAVIIMPLLHIPLPIRPGVLGLYLLTLIGVIGLAFALAGLHLVYKNIDPIVMPLATILLFLTGALSSLEGIPILYPLSRFLPLSIGIDLMRSLLVAGHPLSQLITEPAFYGLLLNSAVYLFVGLAILSWAHIKARTEGSLAHY